MDKCLIESADNHPFKLDSARLHVNVDVDNCTLWTLHSVCHKCPITEYCSLTSRQMKLLINTTFDTSIEIRDSTRQKICSISSFVFGERGEYNLTLKENKCLLNETKSPINSNMPILWAFLFAILLLILYLIILAGIKLFNKRKSGSASAMIIDAKDSKASNSKPKHRLTSLDTFRGISLVVMIFVNYGAGGYWFFDHSAWNGLTVADIVFPWFMFIMGTSLALSMERSVGRVSKIELFRQICRRSILLFLIGVFIKNNGVNGRSWSTVRIMGVLQRFAITYFITASIRLISVKSKARIRDEQNQMSKTAAVFIDILAYWHEYIIYGCILLVWVLITFLLPVPGCPTGYIGPGGLYDNATHPNCTGGATGYIDRLILTDQHMYAYPTCKEEYDTSVGFDPEGLLGCLTSIITVFIGLQIGQIFVIFDDPKSRIIRCLCWSVIYGLIGGALCGFSQNDGVLPVNKNLWTPSFAFVLSSMGLILLPLLYYIIDVKKYWAGEPFYFVGMNSIVIYVAHGVFGSYIPVSWKIDDTSHAEKLYMHLWGTSLWIIYSYYLHYQRVYITL